MKRAALATPGAALAAAVALAVGAAALLPGCGERPSGPDWPDGAFVVARTEALRSLAAKVSALDGTPIGHRAAATAAALPECELVAAHAPDGDVEALASALRCAADGDPLVGAWRAEGAPDAPPDARFGIPLTTESRVLGALRRVPTGDQITLAIPRDALGGPRALLIPGDEAPGAHVLSAREVLIHARLQPDGGIDLASMVPAGGQADQLFGLKSALFAGVVLDGTWELAVYPPGAGASMLRAALALGIARRAAANAAVEELLAGLEERWPLRRAPFALGDAEGGCLVEFELMPELAPCWVTTERALVVGWNAASLRAALAEDGTGATSADAAFVVELARFAEADARLAAVAGDDAATALARAAWPWQRLVARAARSGDAVEVRAVLEDGPGT